MKFKIIINIFILIILLGGISQFFCSGEEKILNIKKGINKNFLIKKIEGNSMEPLLKNGEKVKLFVGYYKKNNLKIGDIVAYGRTGKGKDLYIKILKAKGGDLVYFGNNRLFINGKKMINSVGKEYIFSKNEQKLINLFIKNGKLNQNSYLIFGDNISNSIDSRKFGAIGKKDIIGKFEKGSKIKK